MLPILQRLGSGQGVRALVVTPTRELCAQIDEVARACCKHTGQHVVAVYGGVPYEPQMKACAAASTSSSPRRAACST